MGANNELEAVSVLLGADETLMWRGGGGEQVHM